MAIMAASYDAAASGSDVPTIVTTDEAVWTGYEALLQPQMRYNDPGKNIDGGFRTVHFRGTPIISDEYCTAGYIYWLNEKYLKVISLNHPDWPTDKMGFAVSPLQRPSRQDGKLGYIISYLDLICTNPIRQAVDRGVT